MVFDMLRNDSTKDRYLVQTVTVKGKTSYKVVDRSTMDTVATFKTQKAATVKAKKLNGK